MKPLLALFLFAALPLAAQQKTMLLWPNGTPEPTKLVGPEVDKPRSPTEARVLILASNISKPDMTIFLPDATKNTGAAALVFPGGGYSILSINSEGTEVCDWLQRAGVACLMVKYRVPEKGYFPQNVEDLEDAQQAMRLTRQHAAEWSIDPRRIGVIGFSAGAHLAAVLSTHPDFQGPNVPPSTIDAKPAFQMIVYPAYLADDSGKLIESYRPKAGDPPAFLLIAEDDSVPHIESTLAYFRALKDVKVPADVHIFALGAHGFGMRAGDLPIAGWPALAEAWLHAIHILGPSHP